MYQSKILDFNIFLSSFLYFFFPPTPFLSFQPSRFSPLLFGFFSWFSSWLRNSSSVVRLGSTLCLCSEVAEASPSRRALINSVALFVASVIFSGGHLRNRRRPSPPAGRKCNVTASASVREGWGLFCRELSKCS